MTKIEKCDRGFPEFGMECLRPKGHCTFTCPCFTIIRDPKAITFGMGVYMEDDGRQTRLVDDEFPDDIILEVV